MHFTRFMCYMCRLAVFYASLPSERPVCHNAIRKLLRAPRSDTALSALLCDPNRNITHVSRVPSSASTVLHPELSGRRLSPLPTHQSRG
jgi:hypothetical protein